MAICKVGSDKYGLYIRAGGHIFRPDFPTGYKHLEKEVGTIAKGEKVQANHRGGTSLATVKNKETGAEETWYSHGCYYGYSPKTKISSEEIYRPEDDIWN